MHMRLSTLTDLRSDGQLKWISLGLALLAHAALLWGLGAANRPAPQTAHSPTWQASLVREATPAPQATASIPPTARPTMPAPALTPARAPSKALPVTAATPQQAAPTPTPLAAAEKKVAKTNQTIADASALTRQAGPDQVAPAPTTKPAEPAPAQSLALQLPAPEIAGAPEAQAIASTQTRLAMTIDAAPNIVQQTAAQATPAATSPTGRADLALAASGDSGTRQSLQTLAGTPTPAANAAPATTPSATSVALSCPHQQAPDMPRLALRQRIEGVVTAEILIENGKVTDVAILSGPPVFHQAVRQAVQQYRCTAGQAPMRAQQAFVFKLS